MMPCSLGDLPERSVACTEHVTAGKLGRIGRNVPRLASAARLGINSGVSKCRGERPTTLRTRTCLAMSGHLHRPAQGNCRDEQQEQQPGNQWLVGQCYKTGIKRDDA